MDFIVKRSIRASVSIKVDEKCRVHILIPLWLSDKKAHAIFAKHVGWVAKKIRDCKSKRILLKDAIWPILGDAYKVVKISGKKIDIDGSNVFVPQYLYRNKQQFKRALIAFYKEIIEARINKYVKKYTKQLNENVNRIVLRSSNSRWGSCSSKKNLNFSYRLGFLPEKVIKYVVAHEVAHLKHMNHSKDFWNTVEQLYPDYKKARKVLREYEKVHLI